MITVLLLTISNVFMTFAWYGHLKYAKAPLITAILVSWGIAFAEYCFQVPANRIGHRHFEAAQLKIMQEVITLVVFAAFSVLYLKEPLRWNYIVGFVLILAAVFFVFVVGKPNAPAGGTKHSIAMEAIRQTEP
ncbi:MAG: DMT family protein [Planctomycetaceae bacterium]